MGFDWSAYLRLAEFLSTLPHGPLEEASKRSAVSRAYYAAFCHARNYARDELRFVPTYRAQDHAEVRAWLQRQGTSRTADAAVRLQSLREYRNHCDYRDSFHMLDWMAKRALIDAAEVISLLST
jgi:hypothetical protein